MALTITAGTGNRAETTSPPVTAAPMTMDCRFQCSDTAGVNRLICLKDKDAAGGLHQFSLLLRGDVGGDPVQFRIGDGTTQTDVNTSSGYTANTWYHAMAVESASNSHAVYIDGGSAGTSSTSRTPSGIDWLGLQVQLSGTSTYAGSAGNVTLAEMCVWNAALTTEEALARAKGAPARWIRPSAIVVNWRLGTATDLFSPLGSSTLTSTGTVTTAESKAVTVPFRWGLGIPTLQSRTFTVGPGKDYETLQAGWDAHKNDGAAPHFECYSGADLGQLYVGNNAFTPTSTNYVRVYVADGHQHDGIDPTTGAYILYASTYGVTNLVSGGGPKTDYMRIEGLGIKSNNVNTVDHCALWLQDCQNVVIDGVLMVGYGASTIDGGDNGLVLNADARNTSATIRNSIARSYTVGTGGTYAGFGFVAGDASSGSFTVTLECDNCTGYSNYTNFGTAAALA